MTARAPSGARIRLLAWKSRWVGTGSPTRAGSAASRASRPASSSQRAARSGGSGVRAVPLEGPAAGVGELGTEEGRVEGRVEARGASGDPAKGLEELLGLVEEAFALLGAGLADLGGEVAVSEVLDEGGARRRDRRRGGPGPGSRPRRGPSRSLSSVPAPGRRGPGRGRGRPGLLPSTRGGNSASGQRRPRAGRAGPAGERPKRERAASSRALSSAGDGAVTPCRGSARRARP